MPVTRVEIARHVRAAFALGPASRDRLVDCAVASGARAKVRAILERLPDGRYLELWDLWPELPDLPVEGDGASSDQYRFVIEVDGAGLAYERAVFDLAAQGITLHALAEGFIEWRLEASVGSETEMAPARAALQSYFGARLLRCVAPKSSLDSDR